MSQLKMNAVFLYDGEKTPFTALATVELVKDAFANFKLVPKRNCGAPRLTIKPSNDSFSGNFCVSRFLARVSGDLHLYGQDPVAATQVDFFLDLATGALRSKADLPTHVEALNTHLALRTFLAGPALTIADLAVFETLRSNGRWRSFERKTNDFPHLLRWFAFVASQPCVAALLAPKGNKNGGKAKGGKGDKNNNKKGNKGGAEAAGSKAQDATSARFPLENAEYGKVCVRFPPEPSGYMHIGHVKAVLSNDRARKDWGGRLIVRFDDTNPTKEKQEYVDNILADLKTMGVEDYQLTYTSDSFELMLKYAHQLIAEGKGYVDDTAQAQLQKERFDGIASKCRDLSVEENQRRFAEMLKGSDEGRKMVLRGKVSVDDPNKCMRDPVFYRCSDQVHHRVGDKYKAFPTYDFACPIVDSVEGVTHAMRTTEYNDRKPQFIWVCEALGIRVPYVHEYSRLNFKYTLLSKRKLQWFVDQGMVEGWSDPRVPSVQGILRRGMTVEALRRFVKDLGTTVKEVEMGWDKIWAYNRQVINETSHRYMAVHGSEARKVKLTLTDVKDVEVVKAKLHPKKPEMGMRDLFHSPEVLVEPADAAECAEGEEVTLMSWGNVIINKIVKREDGSVEYMEGVTNPDGNVKKTKKKLNWIPVSKDTVKLHLLEYDHLITAESAQEIKDQDFKDFVREKTVFEEQAEGEPAMRAMKQGQTVELMRRGFYRCDKINEDGTLVLIYVPDGKSKGVSALRG